MDRLVVPYPAPGRASAVSDTDADKALGRLVKYIPAEVLSGYLFLSGLIGAAGPQSNLRTPGAWLLFVVGLVLTPVYLWKIGKPIGVQWWHLPISTISFVLWAYALGGPFASLEIIPGYPYESWFAALLAGIYSWIVPVVWKPEDSLSESKSK